ncbi:MAG TPA: hypothetical protein VEL31_05715 [Ktedonobacteraceae bacterium]|nr:hypothetical protein [Ktedonobacteraceae bacterium]
MKLNFWQKDTGLVDETNNDDLEELDVSELSDEERLERLEEELEEGHQLYSVAGRWYVRP